MINKEKYKYKFGKFRYEKKKSLVKNDQGSPILNTLIIQSKWKSKR